MVSARYSTVTPFFTFSSVTQLFAAAFIALGLLYNVPWSTIHSLSDIGFQAAFTLSMKLAMLACVGVGGMLLYWVRKPIIFDHLPSAKESKDGEDVRVTEGLKWTDMYLTLVTSVTCAAVASASLPNALELGLRLLEEHPVKIIVILLFFPILGIVWILFLLFSHVTFLYI